MFVPILIKWRPKASSVYPRDDFKINFYVMFDVYIAL